MQAERAYSRTEWSVRLCEVGDSGGGADLTGFLTNCATVPRAGAEATIPYIASAQQLTGLARSLVDSTFGCNLLERCHVVTREV